MSKIAWGNRPSGDRFRTCAVAVAARRSLGTQRSNVGHAQMGAFLAAAHQFSRAKIERKTWKITGVTQNLRKKIEKFIEICKRKRK